MIRISQSWPSRREFRPSASTQATWEARSASRKSCGLLPTAKPPSVSAQTAGPYRAPNWPQAGGDRAVALVKAVEEQLQFLLNHRFENIILSAKSTSIPETVRANALLAERYPYPLHVGITEAGPGLRGTVKNSVGIGILLNQGIGDTIRVSLTGPSTTEVETAYSILNALEIRRKGFDLISCPTCGRRRIDVQALVQRLLPNLAFLPDGFSVAVMGCEVNGPREAAHADLGISGSPGGYILFSHGTVIATANGDNLEEVLKSVIGQIGTKPK